jgi:hypothetical protein
MGEQRRVDQCQKRGAGSYHCNAFKGLPCVKDSARWGGHAATIAGDAAAAMSVWSWPAAHAQKRGGS